FELPHQSTLTLSPYTTLFRSPPLCLRVSTHFGQGGWISGIGGADSALGRTTSTGTLANRTIASATEPMMSRRRPWRPCVPMTIRSEEHTSELQSRENLVCRLL